jgi:hypothetical protein
MKDKSTISYWLVLPGENEDTATDILTTPTQKVPEIGEVININTKVDKESLSLQFSHLNEESIRRFIPAKERQVKNDFVVYDVKRWIKTVYYSEDSNKIFYPEASNSTSGAGTRIPMSYEVENFEVYVHPFQNSELTETPIAKLRNLLSPMSGYFQMLEIINEMDENDDKKAEMHVLLNKVAKQSSKTMDKILELVEDQKIWR